MKEKIQRSIWPDAIKGFALFAVSLPFAVVSVLKFVYNLSDSSEHLLNVSNSVVPLYEQYDWIKFMWPISPNPSVVTPISFGNVMALVVIFSSVVGIGWMMRAFNNYFRLLDAKRKAEDQQLIDDFKK